MSTGTFLKYFPVRHVRIVAFSYYKYHLFLCYFDVFGFLWAVICDFWVSNESGFIRKFSSADVRSAFFGISKQGEAGPNVHPTGSASRNMKNAGREKSTK